MRRVSLTLRRGCRIASCWTTGLCTRTESVRPRQRPQGPEIILAMTASGGSLTYRFAAAAVARERPVLLPGGVARRAVPARSPARVLHFEAPGVWEYAGGAGLGGYVAAMDRQLCEAGAPVGALGLSASMDGWGGGGPMGAVYAPMAGTPLPYAQPFAALGPAGGYL